MSHPVDVHVGTRLKTLRILRGLSQTDIAKPLNISFQQVQKYELGRNRISASKLYGLADILRVDVAYFFEGLDDTSDGGPVIDADTAALAGKIAQIKDATHRKQLTGFVDTIIAMQDRMGTAA